MCSGQDMEVSMYSTHDPDGPQIRDPDKSMVGKFNGKKLGA